MDKMQGKIGTWMELIQSLKLQNVSEDIEMNIRVRPDNKLNDGIFKLLLCLCRVIDKYNEQSCKTGKDIAKLAKLLCSLLIKVSDDNNFVKAVFKIVRCLILFDLHEDAAEICSYLKPGNLYNPKGDTMNLLIKVLSLWHFLVNRIYITLTNEPLNAENYRKLKIVVKHEMKMIQIAYKSYTKYLIVEISKHLDRMSAIDKNKTYFDDFCKYILEYLSEMPLYLDEDEKYIIYSRILRIVCHVICRPVNTNDIEFVTKTLDKSNCFEILLAEDEECCQCYKQFRNLCITLLMPMENLVSDSAKSIQNIIYRNLDIAQKYGYAGGLKWNALNITEIVDPMFIYLEKCVETDKHTLERLLDTGILLEIMNLFLHISTDEFYTKQVSIECKWCMGKLCTIKRDLYNAIAMKCRCISLVCKFPVKTLPAEVCAVSRKILVQNVKSIIHEMKVRECKRWAQLWYTCRSIIYNIGVLSEHIYEESVCLFSFLCTSISQFKGIELNSEDLKDSQKVENIISSVFYRLSIVYYSNNMYRKAMTMCAIHALLTYNQSNTKAFYMWINIKRNAPEEIANLTMLKCLTIDKDEIKNELGFSIDTSEYDFTALCLPEAISLLKEQITFSNGVATVLETLKKLQLSNQYAHTVQLLGYYLLGSNHDSTILKYGMLYIQDAIHDLKQDKSNSVAVLCLEANLNFFMFVEELYIMNKQTRLEMENTNFALIAPKLQKLAETKSPNIVPAYTMINIKKDTNLMLCLQKCLKKWKKLFKYYFKEIVQDWEPKLILRILITAGEYARLFRYEDCEAEIWILAYKLASEMNDYTIIYITSRYISLRQINYDWITTAKEHVIKYKDSKDKHIIGAIATFWISLADLYFECGKHNDAKRLLTEASNLPGISFFDTKAVYLLSLDVIIRNSHFYNMQQEDYSSYVEKSRLTMRSLNQDLLTRNWTNQVTYLFSYDTVFTTAVNLSIRINSVLSSRGICPDLVRVLKSAQSINAILRTAELLKSLCYIDLSRVEVDDCEVKLQGLEHMLNIETFQLSMESKSIEVPDTHLAVTPTKIADPIRDIPQRYDASPVLGKKVFELPQFISHTDACDCYKCVNVSYQYLVFVTTYIRAQLYALQNDTAAALEHFYGAFEIRRKLFQEEKSILPENLPHDEIGVKRLSWQIRFYITDYIQLLIDFYCFLKMKMSREEDASDIINLAINMCHKYKLEMHPIYRMAIEIALDNEFQMVLESSDFSFKFTVPQPHDIDINDHVEIPIDPSVCVTPSVQNHCAKKPVSIRRRRSPVALKISKINMIWSDDEDDNSFPSPPPPSATCSNRKFKSRINLVKRKILEEDLADDVANLNIEDSVSKETKLENLNEARSSAKKISTRDVMIKVASSVPDISKSLMNLVDKTDLPATTENITKLMENVLNLRIKSKVKKSIKDTKQLTVADYNRNIDQAIELLKDVTINEKINENTNSSTPTKSENVDKLKNQKIPEIRVERKFFKSKGLKGNIENADNNGNHGIRTTRSRRY